MRNTIVRLFLFTALISTGLTADALAAPGHSGSPPDSAPLLRNGYGAIDIPNDTTTPNGQVGAPAGCGSAEGAAVYRIELTERAKLRIEVNEIDPDGICAVGLYRKRSSGNVLNDLYDIPARAPFTHREIECAGACSLVQTLGSNTHYLAIWPSGSGAVSKAFAIEGTLKALPTITGRLTGKRVGSCRRIDKGGETTLTFQVTPPPAPTTDVSVTRRSRWTGDTTDLGIVPVDPSGEGELTIPAGLRGYHDVKVSVPATPTTEPRTLRLCLIVRGPSKIGIDPRKWRYQYDDYSVWRHGDTMVVRFPVMPGTKARGRMNVRIIRQYASGERYEPFTVIRGLKVKDGVLVFRMKAKYRPGGLPFYRIRGEWLGSHTYKPAKSAYICFQINR